MKFFTRFHVGIIACMGVPVLALAGCGRSDRDATPRVGVDAQWVKRMRVDAANSAAAAGPAAKKGDGWGALQGTIRLASAPVLPPDIVATKDQDMCGNRVKDDSIVVGQDLGLANVIVYLRTKTDVHESYAGSAKEPKPLDNKGCRFEPHVLVMRITQPLNVSNSDTKIHNTKIDSNFNGANKNVQPGSVEPFTLSVPESGPVPVSCSVHPWMRSYVLVKDTPYAAVTDKTGKFAIANLPAGIPLEFQVWHENKPSGLPGESKEGPVDGGRFIITIPKDQTATFDMTAKL